MFDAMQKWLIRLAVGKRPVMANVTFTAPVATYNMRDGYILNCRFTSDCKGWPDLRLGGREANRIEYDTRTR